MWQQTVVQKWISNDNVSLLNLDQSGDSKAFVVTIVATEIMQLDTTGLGDL